MSETMVNIVAQALLEAQRDSDALFDPQELARAAITAMYQATPQILEAISLSVVETTDSEATWTAALDAALEQ